MLVALSVFALAAMALLNLTGENTRAAGTVATRAFADIVAENQAVRTMIATGPLEAGMDHGSEVQAGRTWGWTRRVSGTEDASILRVDIAVTESDGARPISTLSLFWGRR